MIVELKEDSPMPYGKYKGRSLKNISSSYLVFLYDKQKCTNPVRFYIEKNIERLRLESKAEKNVRKNNFK